MIERHSLNWMSFLFEKSVRVSAHISNYQYNCIKQMKQITHVISYFTKKLSMFLDVAYILHIKVIIQIYF